MNGTKNREVEKEEQKYRAEESHVSQEKMVYVILKELARDSKILESQKFVQHGTTSVLRHSIAVAYKSVELAEKHNMNVDIRKLIRGALLHDYFLYDWHVSDKSHRLHGFRHPFTALRNANRDVDLSYIEQDIIKKHMFPLIPLPPKYRESTIVCVADKICSTYETMHMESRLDLYKKVDALMEKLDY